jgi:hypothetical protein
VVPDQHEGMYFYSMPLTHFLQQFKKMLTVPIAQKYRPPLYSSGGYVIPPALNINSQRPCHTPTATQSASAVNTQLAIVET